jgi:hypothetical protein
MGSVVQLPNGTYGANQNWIGTSATAFDEFRGPGRFNIDMTLRRDIHLTERIRVEVSAEASNLLNHTQLSGNFNGNLGSTVVAPNASRGLALGMGSSDTFGTIGTGTYAPREVVMNARVRF